MRVIQLLRTPWCPYSATFASDGARIAVGGGTWYAAGGLLLARLGTDEAELCSLVSLVGPEKRDATVSGVCFSADDRHLVASTWRSSHHFGPTHACAVSGLTVKRAATLVHAYSDPIGDPCPTGVLVVDGRVVVRNDTSMLVDVFAVWQAPLDVQTTGAHVHSRTHSGIVVVDGRLITGGGGSLKLGGIRRDIGWYESGKAADGLVSVPLTGDAPPTLIPVPSCRRITAIATRAGDDGFVTGGLDGEVDRWTRTGGEWRSARLLQRGADPPDLQEKLAWATYTPHSVVAICALADGERWVSVTAGGELRLWRGDRTIDAGFLPERGSPRALAAHPTEPLVAVGIKQQHHQQWTASTVLLAELA